MLLTLGVLFAIYIFAQHNLRIEWKIREKYSYTQSQYNLLPLALSTHTLINMKLNAFSVDITRWYVSSYKAIYLFCRYIILNSIFVVYVWANSVNALLFSWRFFILNLILSFFIFCFDPWYKRWLATTILYLFDAMLYTLERLWAVVSPSNRCVLKCQYWFPM